MERNEGGEQSFEPWGRSTLANSQGKVQETEEWGENPKELGGQRKRGKVLMEQCILSSPRKIKKHME